MTLSDVGQSDDGYLMRKTDDGLQPFTLCPILDEELFCKCGVGFCVCPVC